MTRHFHLAAALMLGAMLLPAPRAAAQDEPLKNPLKDAGAGFQELPPALKLGARGRVIPRVARAASLLVITPDARSYAAAVASWSFAASEGESGRFRFPVLIDDGSPRAAVLIGMFARAFEPKRVVRWSAPEGHPVASTPGGSRELVEAALGAAWGAEEGATIAEHFEKVQHAPAGIVIASPGDSAWPAALALAAGRGQPIEWIDISPLNVDGWLTPDNAAALERRIQAAVADLGYEWEGAGDVIDAVTLACNAPAKVSVKKGSGREYFALTDILGRRLDPGATLGVGRERWAWTGQVFGTQVESAYRAMCSLFLRPDTFWSFDGYPPSGAWTQFDGSAAAQVARRAGMDVRLDDAPRQSADDWRRRAAGLVNFPNEPERPAGALGLDAGLIAVMTKGMAGWFDLNKGRAHASDVPFLAVPAAVYFVHSWSAHLPGDRSTIAGRWLERGAYAYFGSVAEPFLQAFVPTPIAMQRLFAGGALGPSLRNEPSEPWRLGLFADPLYALGPAFMPAPAETTAAALARLEGAEDLGATVATAVKARDFETTARTLLLVGRDNDAARIGAAMLRDEDTTIEPATASMLVGPCARAGDRASVARLAAIALAAPDDAGVDAERVRDLAWHMLGIVPTALTKEEGEALALAIRPGDRARDTAALARVLPRAIGRERADTVIAASLARMSDKQRNEYNKLRP